jgi:hypothetical protein
VILTWLHDEMLSPTWLRAGQPAVFVFDEAWIADERLSLKRIVFLMECLAELPGVEVRRGDVVTEVTAVARRIGATRIQTARSPLPRLKRQGEKLGQQQLGRQLTTRLSVECLDPEPFVELTGRVDLKRFSRYWNKAQRLILAGP